MTPLAPLLRRIGRRTLAANLVRALAAALAPVLGASLGLCLLDNLLHLPAGLRLVAALGCVALLGHGLWRHLWPLRRPSVEATALALEAATQVRDNAVINACQFERLALAGTLGDYELRFLRRTLITAQAAIETPPWVRLLDLRVLALWLVLLGGAGLAWTGYTALAPDRSRNALSRLMLPLADIPPLGAVVITLEPAHDLTVGEGSSVSIAVRIAAVDHGEIDDLAAPVLLRSDGLGPVPEQLDAADTVPLVKDSAGIWRAVLSDLRRSCALRAHCAGTWSPSLGLTVLPPPRLTASRFIVTGPAYSGLLNVERSGPPANLTVLPQSMVKLDVVLERAVPALTWNLSGRRIDLQLVDGHWQGEALITTAGPYHLEVPTDGAATALTIARGSVALDSDNPPSAELLTEDRNRFVDPGGTVALTVTARDDHGLAEVGVEVKESAATGPGTSEKAWTYLGPPGPATATEQVIIQVDPTRFIAGRSYLVQAVAHDRCGSGQEGRSAPVVLRVRSIADLSLPKDDPLAAAFALLKQCLTEQIRARGVSGNVLANLDDIRRHQSLAAQAKAMAAAQEVARVTGEQCVNAFSAAKEGATVALLRPLVDTAMPGVRDDATALGDSAEGAARLGGITSRQDDIIARLTAVLGHLAERARDRLDAKKTGDQADLQSRDRERLTSLKDDLERFMQDQQRILDKSRTLADAGNADLSQDEDRILGDLASSEQEWAKFLEERLTDFSKNPPQDFSDSSLTSEFNAVWQDIKLAADALDGKKIDLAVPQEQMGLEAAASLVNNLEKWLSDAPDKLKWEMEDAAQPADIPLAELPKELEDIVGDLLDQEEAMTEDIQDVTSAWMDSLDKGAGWTAADGPISNMSAKGITGNVLPNQQEVGGRSGEGRTGRSSGQMVQDEAVGKGGQETPTRLDQTPFEAGSVKDSSKDSGGGATGGGKQSGFDQEGLRGPTPPPQLQQAMQRLAGKQQQIRQQAEALVLKLRAQHLPSGDVETAVTAMSAVEEAAQRFDARTIRTRHAAALDTLGDARRTVGDGTRLQQERSRLPERIRQGLTQGSRDSVPPGYEDLVGQYFQALAGQQ